MGPRAPPRPPAGPPFAPSAFAASVLAALAFAPLFAALAAGAGGGTVVKGSRCTLLSPHSFNWLTAQSPAARYCGELVKRGPYRSVRLYIVSMSGGRSGPRPPPRPPPPPPPPALPISAVLILWMTLRSIFSVCCCATT